MIKNNSRSLKAVITLKSGKSIVSTMFEDECFKVYNQWVNYKKDETDNSKKMIVIEKKTNNLLVEVTAILTDEIVAFQITDDCLFKAVK